jgi:hypothetical protein
MAKVVTTTPPAPPQKPERFVPEFRFVQRGHPDKQCPGWAFASMLLSWVGACVLAAYFIAPWAVIIVFFGFAIPTAAGAVFNCGPFRHGGACNGGGHHDEEEARAFYDRVQAFDARRWDALTVNEAIAETELREAALAGPGALAACRALYRAVKTTEDELLAASRAGPDALAAYVARRAATADLVTTMV